MATKIQLDAFHDDPRGRRVDHTFGMLTIGDDGRRRFIFRYREDGWDTDLTVVEGATGFNATYTYSGGRNLRDQGLARVEPRGTDEWLIDIRGTWDEGPFEQEITVLRRVS